MSHRSGETEDTTIADLAVALNCGQIKTGSAITYRPYSKIQPVDPYRRDCWVATEFTLPGKLSSASKSL